MPTLLERPISERKTSSSGIENIIRKALKRHKTPLMLIRRSALEQQYFLFRRNLPQVGIYYAIKANPHLTIIKTFIRLGASFDVASATEMNLVLSLGAKPERIIFANPIKSIEDIKHARNRNVKFMVFDNEPELYKIAKHCPKATVLLRIKVGNVGSLVELSLKFGADPDQAVFLLKKAKQLGLNAAGISFHVGSQCTNAENYIEALEVTAAIFGQAKKEELDLNILDIGGGFPIRHFDDDTHPNFETIARQIRIELKRLFDKNVRVIAEPGRFLTGPAGTLITQVVGRTFRNNKNYYYLNDGIYGDFSGIVFDHCKYEFKTLRRGQKFLSTLAGPTCDSFDTISMSEELPELDVGNVIYVRNIGAYSSASADSKFNGFASAKIVMVD
ncbi:MAG: type III PLP-dependent enzyme [Candidatus Omnitrophica bacterium]|nr:type III PLP-dependent enzyme [Candidatus Omnitrophota bacterium]